MFVEVAIKFLTFAHVFFASDITVVWWIIRTDASVEDEAVWVGGVREGSWVGDDSVKTFSYALILDDGVDEKSVCVGEDKNGGVETSGVLKELDAALHGWVERDLANSVFDIFPLYVRSLVGELLQTFGDEICPLNSLPGFS